MRSRWILIGCLLSVIGVLSASAGWMEDTPDGTVIHVELSRLVIPDPSMTDTASRANIEAVRAFVRRFPALFEEEYRREYESNPDRYGEHDWSNVSVQLHTSEGIQVEGVESVLLAIAGQVAPDVMYVNFRQSDTYIQQGFLYPLDLEDDGYVADMSTEAKEFRIHPKIWPVIRRKGPGGEKHVWAIPFGGALGRVVTYRKDLFDEAGVPYPDYDCTWDDFLHACREITDPERGVYGLRLSGGKHESWWWITFLWSAGGDALVYNEETDEWRAVFDSREAAVALDFYTRLNTEPWVDKSGQKRYGYVYKSSDWASAYAKWNRGEIGMMFEYIDEKLFSSINPDITGMAPVPVGPTGERGAELNSRMMGLFAGIEEPAVRDAAWEYIKFYDSKDAVRIKTRVMVEGGLGRFINPRYLKMFGYPELVRLAPRGWEECFNIAISTGRPEPYGKNCNYAYNLMTEPIQEAENLAFQGRLPKDDTKRLDLLQDLLRNAAAKANVEMLDILSPEQRLKRRVSAAIALLAIVIGFSLVVRRAVRAFTPPDYGVRKRGWELRKYWVAYLLLLPAVATIFLWRYVPLARGSIMAFQDYRIMGNSTWVWLDNFGDILWDAAWWAVVWNALRYSFLVIALTFIPPVILAILLQEVPRGKILFRTIFYLPSVMTGLVLILLWKSFYEPSERGVLNAILMKIPAIGYLAIGFILLIICLSFTKRLWQHNIISIGVLFALVGGSLFYTCYNIVRPIMDIADLTLWAKLAMTIPEPYRWLQNSETAMFACVLPMLWAGMGPGCLIYLAALKGIADDFYEAADLDGATFIDKILFIVFPILKPLLIINFIGVFIASWLYSGANILAMTGGAADTEVASLHIFYKAFIFLKFGPATAMAWMLGLMLIGFTIYQLQILSRLEFRTTGDKE